MQREVEAQVLLGLSVKRRRRARHPAELGDDSAAPGSQWDVEEDLQFTIC